MRPRTFRYTRADSVDTALEALQDNGTPLAGGQSMLPLLKMRELDVEHLVDLNQVTELAGTDLVDGELRLGAMTRHRQLIDSDLLRSTYPSLAAAAVQLGDVQVRNRGTVGGNVCFADPRANLSSVLISLDATAVIASGDAEPRRVTVAALFADFRQSALGPRELLVGFEIPVPEAGTRATYRELAVQPNGLPIVNVAVTFTGQPARSVRIAVGGLAVVPLRAAECEEALLGETLTPELAAEVAQALNLEGAEPLSNFQADASYRARVAKVLLERTLLDSVIHLEPA